MLQANLFYRDLIYKIKKIEKTIKINYYVTLMDIRDLIYLPAYSSA